MISKNLLLTAVHGTKVYRP